MDLDKVLQLDAQGVYHAGTESLLARAFAAAPHDTQLAARLVNYYFASGQVGSAEKVFDDALEACPRLDAETVATFILPAAACGMKTAELGFAPRALDAVPAPLRTELWQRMNTECDKWCEVAEYGDLVAWQRLATAWWRSPCVLPGLYQGKSLVQWMAGRIDYISADEDEVNIHVAMCYKVTASSPKRPPTGLTRITTEKWRQLADYPLPESGSYLEIGVYRVLGDAYRKDTVIIRETPMDKPERVLSPEPSLDRYLKNSLLTG